MTALTALRILLHWPNRDYSGTDRGTELTVGIDEPVGIVQVDPTGRTPRHFSCSTFSKKKNTMKKYYILTRICSNLLLHLFQPWQAWFFYADNEIFESFFFIYVEIRFKKNFPRQNSAARILSPNPTQRPLPRLQIQSIFYGSSSLAILGPTANF